MKFFIINYGTKIYDKYHMFVFNMLKIKKIYNFMFQNNFKQRQYEDYLQIKNINFANQENFKLINKAKLCLIYF